MERQSEPRIVIAPEALWAFAEFVGMHRLRAEFSYHGGQFQVAFPHLSHEALERVLDDWEIYRAGESVVRLVG